MIGDFIMFIWVHFGDFGILENSGECIARRIKSSALICKVAPVAYSYHCGCVDIFQQLIDTLGLRKTLPKDIIQYILRDLET